MHVRDISYRLFNKNNFLKCAIFLLPEPQKDLDEVSRVDVFQRVLELVRNETTSFIFESTRVKAGGLFRVKRNGEVGISGRILWELSRPERARNLEKLAKTIEIDVRSSLLLFSRSLAVWFLFKRAPFSRCESVARGRNVRQEIFGEKRTRRFPEDTGRLRY